MSALVDVGNNTGRQLDRKPQPDEQVTEQDVTDAPKLARLLTRILSELATFRRKFAPRAITFRNIVSDGESLTPFTARLTHRFGGEVNWSIVGVKDVGVSTTTLVHETDGTDKDTLVLLIYYSATFAIRVEERG